jgi:hypothetical protein
MSCTQELSYVFFCGNLLSHRTMENRRRKVVLKQAWDLCRADFERYPVWIGVHGVDESEWWYEKTDEVTYRPWTGSLPASPEEGDLRVSATMELPNGSRYEGYVSPVSLNWVEAEAPLAACQSPSIFVGNKRFDFWGGMVGIPLVERRAFYSAVGLPVGTAFPFRFSAKLGLASGITEGTVLGFYKLVKKEGSWVGQIECDEAPASTTALASHLTAVPPPVDRSPTSQYVAYLRESLPEAIKKVESDPSDRGLYRRVCFFQFQLQDFEGCLAYSDAGLAAVGGDRTTRDWYAADLTFLGARVLFELGRYQEALDRLVPLSPSHGTTWGDATLMNKKALVNACKAALNLERRRRASGLLKARSKMLRVARRTNSSNR